MKPIIRATFYVMIIILLMITIYMTYLNYDTNAKLVKTAEVCKAIEYQDYIEIGNICSERTIQKLMGKTYTYGDKSFDLIKEKWNITNESDLK